MRTSSDEERSRGEMKKKRNRAEKTHQKRAREREGMRRADGDVEAGHTKPGLLFKKKAVDDFFNEESGGMESYTRGQVRWKVIGEGTFCR